MSLEAMTWAFKQSLRPAEKVLLLAIADYADDKGECWPAIGTLVEKTGLSVRTIRTHLRMLEHLELLTTEARVRENGSRTSNHYLLHMGQTPPAESAGAPGELLPGQEPSVDRPDQDKASRSSLVAASDRTDSKLSPTMKFMAARRGLTETDLAFHIGDSIEAWCQRYLGMPERLAVALWLLDKAKEPPRAPMLYVKAAIKASPIEVQKYIDDAGLGS